MGFNWICLITLWSLPVLSMKFVALEWHWWNIFLSIKTCLIDLCFRLKMTFKKGNFDKKEFKNKNVCGIQPHKTSD